MEGARKLRCGDTGATGHPVRGDAQDGLGIRKVPGDLPEAAHELVFLKGFFLGAFMPEEEDGHAPGPGKVSPEVLEPCYEVDGGGKGQRHRSILAFHALNFFATKKQAVRVWPESSPFLSCDSH